MRPRISFSFTKGLEVGSTATISIFGYFLSNALSTPEIVPQVTNPYIKAAFFLFLGI